MRKTFAATALLMSCTAAHAQNSTSNCYVVGASMQCNTYTQPDYAAQSQQIWQTFQQQQQQQQQQFQQNMQNLGAAIAINAERRRERKAAEHAAAEQATITAAAAAAIAADTAIAEPPPADEKATLLTCTIDGQFVGSLSLYERHNRVDVTTETGVTKTRTAAFTATAVTWTGPVWSSALSRLDGSYVGTSILPAMKGATIHGACAVTADRKF